MHGGIGVAVLTDDGNGRMPSRCRLGELHIHVGDVADIRENPDLRLSGLALDDRLEQPVDGELHVALCIGQLYKYTSGHIRLGGQEVADLTKQDMAYSMGMVSQTPFIFEGSILENLLYACRAVDGPDGAGKTELPTLDDIIAVLHQTGLFADVLRFGLNTLLSPDRHAELVDRVIRVRHKFQERYGTKLADYVEFFDETAYLAYSSVAENLTFGAANAPEFAGPALSESPYFLAFLKEAGLDRILLALGARVARQTVDILGNLPAEAVFFEQSPIGASELADYKEIVEHLRRRKTEELDAEDRRRLLNLALRFTPGIHKMTALSDAVERLLLEKRALFRANILRDLPGAFSFFSKNDYIFPQTILNNIFFGKTKASNPQAEETIVQSIIQLLIERDLLETIVEIGMHYNVGSKGDKLSGGQRQKLAIARVFLKGPRLLIMDEATSALDNRSQARIQNLLETRWKRKSTLVAVVHRLDTVQNFDRIAVMKAGKIIESGSYSELIARKGALYELVGRK